MLDTCMEDLPMDTVPDIDILMVTMPLLMARGLLMLNPRLMLDIFMEDLPMDTVPDIDILMVTIPMLMARGLLMPSLRLMLDTCMEDMDILDMAPTPTLPIGPTLPMVDSGNNFLYS